MQSPTGVDLDSPSVWLVYAVFGRPLSLCKSLRAALEKAYELSPGAGLFDAPSALVQAGTNTRVEADQILALWRKLDFPV